MARVGQILEHPVTGERLEFVEHFWRNIGDGEAVPALRIEPIPGSLGIS